MCSKGPEEVVLKEEKTGSLKGQGHKNFIVE